MKNNFILLLSVIAISCNQTKVNESIAMDNTADSLNISANHQEIIPQETAEEKKNREEELEKIRKEKEFEQLYSENSLRTGSTPYIDYFGSNEGCESGDCSKIVVTTSNSDVIVTIKRNEEVVRHAYIQAGDTYSFNFPNGTYQTFFYYGKGWNPEKAMKGGELIGGFISNEEVGKDDPQSLLNNILKYRLVLQENGNFSTQPSNLDEAL